VIIDQPNRCSKLLLNIKSIWNINDFVLEYIQYKELLVAERLLSKARDVLPLSMRKTGSLVTATAVTLGIAGCGPQHKGSRSPGNPPKPADALVAHVACTDNTKAAVGEVVQPRDSDEGKVAFTCIDPHKTPHQPLDVIALDVSPYDYYPAFAPILIPDDPVLGITSKEFVFKLFNADPSGKNIRTKTYPMIGSTPFTFVGLSGINAIQGPVRTPTQPPLPVQASPNSLPS
jgi:hypothetical protein